MKGWMIYSLVVTVLAVAAAGFAIGFVVSGAIDDDETDAVQATAEPTEQRTAPPEPQPTEYQPVLTGAEAAAKAKAKFITAANTEEARQIAFCIECDAEDFNIRDKAWIVQCLAPNGVSFRMRVDDQTGEAEVLG